MCFSHFFASGNLQANFNGKVKIIGQFYIFSIVIPFYIHYTEEAKVGCTGRLLSSILLIFLAGTFNIYMYSAYVNFMTVQLIVDTCVAMIQCSWLYIPESPSLCIVADLLLALSCGVSTTVTCSPAEDSEMTGKPFGVSRGGLPRKLAAHSSAE